MSLFYYYGLLKEKEEQLQRLKKSYTQLQGIKQEFSSYRMSIKSPEFSAFTWQGSLATKFEYIRNEGMFHYYQDIETQLINIFSAIGSKMQFLESEITSIKQSIALLELQLAEEKALKKYN
ncbi:YwqH-like family protein [Peribacillus frigoritolerans]|uniref:YwqH-like family protein n=1 Tax=Peribacillus frigoritolerans TaxID=450367 RepID=UPI0020BE76F7|nr:DUF5082 family protein [Peribacillus frigoritolerans]